MTRIGARRRTRSAAVACVLALLVTGFGERVAASEDAADVADVADTVAPTVWVVKTGEFVADSTVETFGFFDDPTYYYSAMLLQLAWGAKDDSGICGYRLADVKVGAPPVVLVDNELVTTFTVIGNEYDGDFGGGSTLTAGWEVTAIDCAGNEASAFIPNRPATIQEDGSSSSDVAGVVSYVGDWKRSACDCSSGGTTRHTWDAGATVSYTADFRKGEHTAIVMPVGPDRGRVRILLDGVPDATIDTYADTPGDRRVVWESWMSAGEHTISVVNLSTPGRRRIDIDAFLHSQRAEALL